VVGRKGENGDRREGTGGGRSGGKLFFDDLLEVVKDLEDLVLIRKIDVVEDVVELVQEALVIVIVPIVHRTHLFFYNGE
jgi:hypothetical protein